MPAPATQPALTDDVCAVVDKCTVGAAQIDKAVGQSAGPVKEEVTGSPTGAATHGSVPIDFGACAGPITRTRSSAGQSAAHRTFETRPGQIRFKSVDPGTLLPVVAGMTADNLAACP